GGFNINATNQSFLYYDLPSNTIMGTDSVTDFIGGINLKNPFIATNIGRISSDFLMLASGPTGCGLEFNEAGTGILKIMNPSSSSVGYSTVISPNSLCVGTGANTPYLSFDATSLSVKSPSGVGYSSVSPNSLCVNWGPNTSYLSFDGTSLSVIGPSTGSPFTSDIIKNLVMTRDTLTCQNATFIHTTTDLLNVPNILNKTVTITSQNTDTSYNLYLPQNISEVNATPDTTNIFPVPNVGNIPSYPSTVTAENLSSSTCVLGFMPYYPEYKTSRCTSAGTSSSINNLVAQIVVPSTDYSTIYTSQTSTTIGGITPNIVTMNLRIKGNVYSAIKNPDNYTDNQTTVYKVDLKYVLRYPALNNATDNQFLDFVNVNPMGLIPSSSMNPGVNLLTSYPNLTTNVPTANTFCRYAHYGNTNQSNLISNVSASINFDPSSTYNSDLHPSTWNSNTTPTQNYFTPGNISTRTENSMTTIFYYPCLDFAMMTFMLSGSTSGTNSYNSVMVYMNVGKNALNGWVKNSLSNTFPSYTYNLD
ncbi:MAG: hypothetical protein WB421_00410, partial [Terriglobales bacterium]